MTLEVKRTRILLMHFEARVIGMDNITMGIVDN